MVAAAAEGAAHAETGKVTGPDAEAWAALLERLVRGLESGSHAWTIGRRKEGLRRVIAANRRNLKRLQERLEPLVNAWEQDRSGAAVVEAVAAPELVPAPTVDAAKADALTEAWPPVVHSLEQTVRAALPTAEPRAAALAEALADATRRIVIHGAKPDIANEVDALCAQARRLIAHRHHLLDELGELCTNLTDGLTELAEDQAWAQGQAEAMRAHLAEGLDARAVRAVGELLGQTRRAQVQLRRERDSARSALRDLLPRLVSEVAALDADASRFEGDVGRHVAAIAQAETPESLAAVAELLLEETREVRARVGAARERMSSQSRQAEALQSKVRELEGELRRLSDEVSIDALTQVANRRGLQAAFEAEVAKLERARAAGESGPAVVLSAGLIDIDNFKKLNDSLGHAAGDKALAALAAGVRAKLRPQDHVARFGGEEFVVLLPGIDAAAAQVALTRLQRELSASLFMHEGRDVLITFSAGVTVYRFGEALGTALERADEALYEAKRAGKNRTCVG
jgi:diguanylate cyclase